MKTKTVVVNAITSAQKKRMFQIMSCYYDHVSLEDFEKDLAEKTHVILLCGDNSELYGFSTILRKTMMIDGKKIVALFSGDTVLDRDHWGNGALGAAFGQYLTKVKIENLTSPVYWFLISKGYRTYLLMANNFPVHFPRYEKDTPQRIKNVMKAFYSEKFGTLYDAENDLMSPQGISCALKVSVADIDDSLLKHPRISFFAMKNPNWMKGHELTCIAQVTLWVPVRYLLKRISKRIQRLFTPRTNRNVSLQSN